MPVSTHSGNGTVELTWRNGSKRGHRRVRDSIITIYCENMKDEVMSHVYTNARVKVNVIQNGMGKRAWKLEYEQI